MRNGRVQRPVVIGFGLHFSQFFAYLLRVVVTYDKLSQDLDMLVHCIPRVFLELQAPMNKVRMHHWQCDLPAHVTRTLLQRKHC